MTNQNDSDGLVERPIIMRGEDGADVEGHIRPAHTSPEVRAMAPAEIVRNHNDEDEGPDVEGHIIRL